MITWQLQRQAIEANIRLFSAENKKAGTSLLATAQSLSQISNLGNFVKMSQKRKVGDVEKEDAPISMQELIPGTRTYNGSLPLEIRRNKIISTSLK